MDSIFRCDIDAACLQRAAAGDVEACERVYRRFAGPVYTLARRLCRSAADADDVLQDTFLDAFERLHQFRGDGPFWGWLRRIAVNTALMRLRRESRWDGSDPEAAADRHAPAAGHERRLDLESALARLPAASRAVVWLHDVEGFTHQEIAQAMGRSTSFSKSQLARAHRRLREWLTWQHDSDGDTRIRERY